MGKARRSQIADSSVVIGELTHSRSSNSPYPARQPVSRKKGNPVSIHGPVEPTASVISVIGPSNQLIAQHSVELDGPYDIAVAAPPFDFGNHPTLQNEVKCPVQVQNFDAYPSTPSKKKRTRGDGEAISPKRRRELENEQHAREKKKLSEKLLSDSRAALPSNYRKFVETQVIDRFGPRTKEIAGGNPSFDSKMYIADVMARGAVSLEHLGLILKHNGLDVLYKAIAMEEAEKSWSQGEGSASTSGNPNYPLSPSIGQVTAELAQYTLDPFLLVSMPGKSPSFDDFFQTFAQNPSTDA